MKHIETAAVLRDEFAISPGVIYVDAATYGPAPNATVASMTRALEAWRSGEADWIEDWDRTGEAARASFASLIGAGSDEIALLPASSVGIAVVATALRSAGEVVVPADEFTSVLFPLMVVARERGLVIREVPFRDLSDAIGPGTRLVAFSLVRMQTGEMASLNDICAAAAAHGSEVLVDATQALPFVDLRQAIGHVDYLVCSAYKHLLCPRGAAFLYVRQDRWDRLSALNANWRAADQPYARYFGGPLTLAPNAARFDVSLAWFAWVGAAESLRSVLGWRDRGRLASVTALAAQLAAALSLDVPSSTLVCAPIRDLEAARARLRENSIRAAIRGSAIRFSPHVYNTALEIERVADIVRPLVSPT